MKNKILSRSGINPRVICYSMSFSPRKLEFLDPPKLQKPQELKGNFKTKVNSLRKEKLKQFKKFLLPDTFRTTNPPNEPIIQDTYNSSRTVYSPGNIHSITYKEDIIPQRVRGINRRNFMSTCMDVSDESFNINVINNSSKNEIKQTPLSIYNKTTQIVALPGGVKRDSSLINDNHSYRNYQMKSTQLNTSFAYKITREYRTNVSCLPAKNYNTHIKDMDMPNERSLSKYKDKYKMENSEYNIISPRNESLNKSVNLPSSKITNIRVVDNNNVVIKSGLNGEINNGNYHLFKTPCKKLVNLKNSTSSGIDVTRHTRKSISRSNLLTTSEERRIIESSKGKKPDYIKSAFQSQIQLF